MREGTASHTARSVAARRLEYARAAAPYGDQAADEALSRDVAGGLTPRPSRMHEYLRARTAFFDRVVVDAVEQGITQVVIGGAGYDGRAFRYRAPGVRWFEVDHPATQADKRERLTRLGIDTAHVSFITADFTADPVAAPLRSAGLDTARPALFLFEGVAVYLEREVTERALAEFRAVAADGSLLAISVSVGAATSQTRARFQQRVAKLGEPARTVLTAEAAGGLLAAAGWQAAQAGGRQRLAGLLLARAANPQPQPERVRPAHVPRPPAAASSAPGVTPARGDAADARSGRSVADQQAARLPLSALLSQALVAFTIEADNEAEHRLPHSTTNYGSVGGGPWLTSLLMWANCLRHLPDEGITVAELRSRARTGTNLDGMRRWRYVTFTPDPGRGKRPDQDAVIAPTRWGIAARDTWQQVTTDVEARWRHRLGASAFDALRGALAGVAENLDPGLPDCLPILGYGLFTRPDPAVIFRGDDDPPYPPTSVRPGLIAKGAIQSGPAGRTEAARTPAARTPAARTPAGRVPVDPAALPLWALLSRPLLAFALQYESEPGPSLAMSADVLPVLTEPGLLVKDIPALAGVSKEAVAMAMTALRGFGLAAEEPDPAGSRFRLARLTRRGRLARDEYPALAADIEADWRARFGDETVAALRRALEPLAAGDPPPLFAGLEPYPDNWRAKGKPVSVLPHYPMTLHRGGYPDGS